MLIDIPVPPEAQFQAISISVNWEVWTNEPIK